jgi:hypothetical protein
MTVYVFEGTEVTKTGRRAEKKIPIPGKSQVRVFEMIEITPTDPDLDWKKWVRPEDLYEIMDEEPGS